MYVRLKDEYGKDVYINPDRVNCIRDLGGGVTVVEFADDHKVGTRMESGAVV